jgi:hypothetical protein
LTVSSTFDVINFANCPIFRIERGLVVPFRVDMNANNEFFFADPMPIHRVSANYSLERYQPLKQAHPKTRFDSFLAWRLRWGREALR